MKKINSFLKLLVLTISFTACNSNSREESIDTKSISKKSFKQLEKATWLLGNWHHVSEDGIALEMWEQVSDSSFAGKSCFIVGKDTVSSETVVLEQVGANLYYVPTVKGQNNNQPVKFTLTSASEKQLVFENPKHDFPQKIAYMQVTGDSLVAEISGKMNGKENKQQFPLTRIK